MPTPEQEKQLVMVAVGVVLFSIIAVIAFIYGQVIIFYVCAVIAIALGFYLSYTLSQERQQDQQIRKKK